MRLDVYLKITRLIPRRGSAADICREGRIEVNGKPAKAGRQVRIKDTIRYRAHGREMLVEITKLPEKKSVSKVEARSLYSIQEDRRFDIWGREVIKKDTSSEPEGDDRS